jgi:methyl-accepting chemotaxis protein
MEGTEKKKVPRRSYLVKGSLQWKILAWVMGMLITFSLFLALGFYFPLLYILYSNLPGESVILQQTAYFYLSMEKYIWISVPVVMVLIGIYSMILSHRIAGPLYRLEKTLLSIGEGDLSQRIRLRKHDELKDFGSRLNQTLDRLEGYLREALQALDEVERVEADLSSRSHPASAAAPDMEAQLLRLKESTSRLRQALSSFRLSSPPGSGIPPK